MDCIQIQAGGWIWSMGCSLPAPGVLNPDCAIQLEYLKMNQKNQTLWGRGPGIFICLTPPQVIVR